MLDRVIKQNKEKNPLYEKLTVYAYNCVGQNKNNFVVKYLILLVHIGIFKEANLKFFIKGHTRNACDRGFGHIRKYVLRQDIWTMRHLTEAVENAAVSSKCISLEDEDAPFSNYKIPLDEIYNNIKKITSFQLFRSTSEKKGVVECFLTPKNAHQMVKLTRSYDGIEVSVENAKRILGMITHVAPPPPKLEKMMDMYTKVRPSVPPEYQADVIYHQPTNKEELMVSKIKRARKENRMALSRVHVPDADGDQEGKENDGNFSEDFAC
jgi:hypothetical protein